jgi:glyoxylase-like metal-dependent hydrolase (beta-lactamase superfamily II)
MEDKLLTDWAPSNLEKWLEDIKKNRSDRAWLYEGLRIVLPTRVFEEKYKLNGIEMIYFGGHTDCSSVVYIPEDRVLFAGDLMFAEMFPWAGDPTADPDTWINAFKTILAMDVETIVPGHGPICNKDEVRIQLKWFEAIREEMRRLISEGASEQEAVSYEVYPDFYESIGDRRQNSLKHWYRVWSRKIGKTS